MLSGTEIYKQFEAGEIVIEPYAEAQLNPNSYDVRLGEYFWLFSRQGERQKRYYKARRYMTLGPGERVLGHTVEFIGSKTLFVPSLHTKSTVARYGIDVCGSAGFGDVGFTNRWTLEIVNLGSGPIDFPVGMRIAQVSFTRLDGEAPILYTGKYNRHREDWRPEDMLPKPLEDLI